MKRNVVTSRAVKIVTILKPKRRPITATMKGFVFLANMNHHVYTCLLLKKTNSGLWYTPSELEPDFFCTITLKCQLCGQVGAKSTQVQHIYSKHNECILCGTKRACHHIFVHKHGQKGFPNTSCNPWTCKRIETCSLCGENKPEDSIRHHWVHKPTSDTLPNVAIHGSFLFFGCAKLLECDLCGDIKYIDQTEHVMFHQACRNCGFQNQDCRACSQKNHDDCVLTTATFAYSHKLDEKGQCERCHMRCAHSTAHVTFEGGWITVDDKHCTRTASCNNCAAIINVDKQKVFGAIQSHVWEEHKCKDCGYERSEKQQKRLKFIELVDNAKKQCLEMVGDKFEALKTDGLNVMDS